MDRHPSGGHKPPDTAATAAVENWRTDWRNIDERRRARIRREAAGASRDLTGGHA